MSSGFVRAGTDQEPVEPTSDWVKAQQQIDATRHRKEEAGKQEGGKSLYDVLQANKAAKQEAFEESIRLKNQFRSLDEDEVDFLDSVLESTRAKEAAVKKETAEQLETFRRQRETADKEALGELDVKTGEESASGDTWATNPKKRRRGPVKEGLGIKARRTSSTVARDSSPVVVGADDGFKKAGQAAQTAAATPKDIRKTTTVATPHQMEESPSISPSPHQKQSSMMGLGAYSSEEE